MCSLRQNLICSESPQRLQQSIKRKEESATENGGTMMKALDIRKRGRRRQTAWLAMIDTYWSCDILQSATATPPVQPQHPHPPIPSLND